MFTQLKVAFVVGKITLKSAWVFLRWYIIVIGHLEL